MVFPVLFFLLVSPAFGSDAVQPPQKELYINSTHRSLTAQGHPLRIEIWLRDLNASLPLPKGVFITPEPPFADIF